MGFFKDIFKFKQSIPVILLIIGVIAFVVLSWDPTDLENSHNHWYKFLYGLSNVIVTSALVSFLIDSVEFMGVFRRALEDIIYDSKYLKKRKDIDQIWVNVSKEMFKSKFPQISTPLMQAVRQYFKNDDDLKLRYFEDYVNTYTITLDETDKNFIQVINDETFTINVEDNKAFDLPMNLSTCASEENKDKTFLKIDNVSVNGENVKVKITESKYENNEIKYECKLPLGGDTKYKIKQTITKKYSLQDDNFIGFFAKWLVCGMRIKVFYPKELGILFVNRGVMGSFEPLDIREKFIEYEYKGMILKRQGYILTIIPKLTQL